PLSLNARTSSMVGRCSKIVEFFMILLPYLLLAPSLPELRGHHKFLPPREDRSFTLNSYGFVLQFPTREIEQRRNRLDVIPHSKIRIGIHIHLADFHTTASLKGNFFEHRPEHLQGPHQSAQKSTGTG